MSDPGETAARPTTPDDAGPPRRRNWLRLALLASVALNLLVVGAIGAHFLRSPPGPEGIWTDGRALVRGLPRERREMIFDAFRARRDDMRARRQAVGEARRLVGEALRSGDEDGIDRAFGELADAESEAMRQLRGVMAEIGARLSPDEREAFAEYLEHRGRRGRGRDRDRQDDD